MKTWLTVAEGAEYAGVSRDTIYTACERGVATACGSAVSKPPLHGSTMDTLSRFFQGRALRPIL